ncbi:MAG: MlaD family protein [Candidatus Omnitrophica bacterium]|nr:MlaD family protein [Candidatus Omnitrophota bacterium]
MIKKANKKIIGAFVVGAVALLIAAILIFGSGALFKQADKYVLFFDGSVKGLSSGAPVIFRGVKIGNVTDISPIYDSKSKKVLIGVVIEVELSRVEGFPERIGYPNYELFITKGLRAGLEVQNFITGQLMIGFDFYPDEPIKMYGVVEKYPELPTLPVSPAIFDVMNQLPIKDIADNLKQTVTGINNLINSGGSYGLNNMLQEVSEAARSLRFLVEYLEKHPESLLKGKQIPKKGAENEKK